MTAANSNLFKDYEKWLRVATLIDFAGRNLCHTVLHTKEHLPTDGAKLYKELEVFKSKICRYKDQQEILCPSNGITDERLFDLTLYTSIIDKKFPKKYDSLITDLRNCRNTEFHRGNKELSDSQFNQLWNDTTQMLQKHGFDIQLVHDLKTCDLSLDSQFKDIVMHILHIFIKGKVKKSIHELFKSRIATVLQSFNSLTVQVLARLAYSDVLV